MPANQLHAMQTKRTKIEAVVADAVDAETDEGKAADMVEVMEEEMVAVVAEVGPHQHHIQVQIWK